MNSIATELWDEWASLSLLDEEETNSSELVGLVMALPFKKNKKIKMEKEKIIEEVYLATSRFWALRRLNKLWKNSKWKSELNFASFISVPINMKGRVELSLPLGLYNTISSYNYTGNNKWAWLRGVWGGCGSLYIPKTGYYLAIRSNTEFLIKRVTQILRKACIFPSERTYGKKELIIRNQQEIVAFLSKIGLSGVSLQLEDKAILRSMRDQANRIRNCDTANINKSLKAAEEQLELAKKICNSDSYKILPQNLKELVEARLAHPEESLSESGRRLLPPVTKSTVKYRWQRLYKFIQEHDI